MSIFTTEMVDKAVELAKPAILNLLTTPGMTWGPQWVEMIIAVPGILEKNSYTVGKKEEWKDSWGAEKDFKFIANRKCSVVQREKCSTREVVKLKPWLLLKNEFLYVGGDYVSGISVIVSGALGTTDECIAGIIIATLKMLAYRDVEEREAMQLIQI
jgi:hypothetical protein